MTSPRRGNKQEVLARLYALCQEKGDMTFDNNAVREVAAQVGFRNPFDATKIDNSALLPAELQRDDAFVIHLGSGRHRFVAGIANGYHLRYSRSIAMLTLPWPCANSGEGRFYKDAQPRNAPFVPAAQGDGAMRVVEYRWVRFPI